MRQLLFFVTALAAMLAQPALATPPDKQIAQKPFIELSATTVTSVGHVITNSADTVALTDKMRVRISVDHALAIPPQGLIADPSGAKLSNVKDTGGGVQDGASIIAVSIGHGKLWQAIHRFGNGADVTFRTSYTRDAYTGGHLWQTTFADFAGS